MQELKMVLAVLGSTFGPVAFAVLFMRIFGA